MTSAMWRNLFFHITVLLACALVLCPPASVVYAEPVQSAAEIDYPPFSIVGEDGHASGFSVELMRSAIAAMGREVTFRTGPWAEVRGWLEKDEIQALPLVGRTPERESLFDFTFPYMSLHGAIVVREDRTDIHNIADLHGRRVAVMKGDNAEEFLRRKDYGIEIHTTDTFEQALHELAMGRHDAVIIQRLVALRILQETEIPNLRVIDRPVEDFRQDFCFAVRKGDSKTLALLNEGLSIAIANGTYRSLHAKWFAALELPSHRRIVVGGDHNYPPYEFLDERGRPTGYNVDLTRAIARESGLETEIRLGPWAEIRELLARGQIDVIQGLLYSPERDLTFDFAPPHTVNHYISVVRKGDGRPAPETIGDLADLQIVVQAGDIMHDFMVENGFEEQVATVDSQEHALRELAEGMHDCALVSRLTALYLISRYEWTHLVMGQRPLLSPEYGFAVPSGQKALLAHFSEGLRILEESGEYRRISDKWLGVYREQPESLTHILRYFAIAIVPLLFILFMAFLWSWSLRQQVAYRTEKLRESMEFQRAMIACSPTALYSTDMKGDVLAWNASAEKIFGWTQEEVIGHPLPVIAGNTKSEFAGFRNRIEDGGMCSGIEVIRQRKDGSRFHARLSAAAIHDSKGHIIGIMSSTEDITESKQAEQRIEHLNRVLMAIREVNRLIVREKDRHELISKTCRVMVNNRSYASVLIVLTCENDRPVSWAEAGMGDAFVPINALLESGELPSCCAYARSMKKTTLIEDRNTVCVNCPVALECAETNTLCVRLVHDGEAFGYIAAALEKNLGMDPEEQSLFSEMAEDIANALRVLKMEEAREKADQDRKAMENQLRQAQKMESIGRLAGGVAHDFNNMLTIINGYAEMMKDSLSPSDAMHDSVREIHEAGKRSAVIVRKLLAFARKQTIAPVPMNLNDSVSGMLKMLQRLIGENIDLLWKPGKDIWPVKMDLSQIDQILVNLVVNSRDAISDIGKITIETHNVLVDDKYCENHAGFVPGAFVILAVSDNGCGMDNYVLDNLFEPFFTTKATGRGTGLGLPTVFGIVKQNNGFLNVYSEPGQGTTFGIYLPRHSEDVAAQDSESTDAQYLSGNGETILVVEDEIPVANLTRTMLEKLGYQVLVSTTAREAMAFVKSHGSKIDLVMTDVVMPEMNGRDLANQVNSLYPNIKTLFMSGYTANVIAHHGILDEGVYYIQKPFSLQDLAVKVREAIEQA